MVEYYKINHGEKIAYFAAESENAVRKLIEILGAKKYDIGLLEKISEEEARKSPFFEVFEKTGHKLCCDKTWILGIVDSKE